MLKSLTTMDVFKLLLLREIKQNSPYNFLSFCFSLELPKLQGGNAL